MFLAAPAVSGKPLKNGRRPDGLLPQTRARPLLDTQRLYFGMREADFVAFTQFQGWTPLERNSRLLRRDSLAALYLPGGESLGGDDSPSVFVQGFFVRVYFERGRLTGLQLLPNFGEGGLSLGELQALARAWFPDDRMRLRYQILPEDMTQQVIEAIFGRVPDAFADLVGRAPVPFQSLVLVP